MKNGHIIIAYGKARRALDAVGVFSDYVTRNSNSVEDLRLDDEIEEARVTIARVVGKLEAQVHRINDENERLNELAEREMTYSEQVASHRGAF